MRIGSLIACLTAAALWSVPAPAAAQEAGEGSVGTIELVVDGEEWVFDVVEGPPGEGFSTGYNVSPRGEAMVVGASLHGRARGSDAEAVISVAFWQESLEHMCDPFANQVRIDGRRLRPGAGPSETCPPPPGGEPGGLALYINLTEASVDEETGRVRVAGTFAGPLGRGDDAPRATRGRFEATLRPFRELTGSR